MTEQTHPFGAGLARPWIIANVAGFTIGGGLAGGVLRFLEQPYYDSHVSALQAGILQAIGLGAATTVWAVVSGAAQLLILRRAFDARWWLPATVFGWALSGLINGFQAGGSVSQIGPAQGPVPPVVALLVGVPLIIFGFVGFQWLVLRRAFTGANLWPVSAIAGLALGVGLGLAIAKMIAGLGFLAPTDFPSAPVFIIIGGFSGASYGAATWGVLRELRPR